MKGSQGYMHSGHWPVGRPMISWNKEFWKMKDFGKEFVCVAPSPPNSRVHLLWKERAAIRFSYGYSTAEIATIFTHQISK